MYHLQKAAPRLASRRGYMMALHVPRREREDENYLSSARREYHNTPRTEILPLVGAVIVVGIGYVVYQKTRGDTVMPKDAEAAKEAFKRQKAQQDGLRSPDKK